MSSAPSGPETEAARAAGLRYVTDADSGIRRRRCGRGFSYEDPERGPVRDSTTIERIRALAVPPAWTDVWICRRDDGHLQATGRDVRARKQYRYHASWNEVRGQTKFGRLAELGAALPDLRHEVDTHLAEPGLGPDRVVALVVRLLDETLVRVGNERYALDNDSYGLTTLRQDHVSELGPGVRLSFRGKSGIGHEVDVSDRRVASVVRRCHELGGQHLFTWKGEDGEPVPVSSSDVNEALRRWTGLDVTAKDFRTWGGTVCAVEHLASCDGDDVEHEILSAIDHAAGLLRNTRAVCRSSYVHPAVLDAHRTGDLSTAWRSARSTTGHSRAERTTLALLS